MIQEEINYRDIMDLGFNEDMCSDSAYENQYGYPYSIITLNLTKRIYLDWEKETRICSIVRIDSPKKGNIKAKRTIANLDEVKDIIKFFLDQD